MLNCAGNAIVLWRCSALRKALCPIRNDMKISSRENAEHYEWGNGCDGWHLVKTESLSVIQERVPPGGSEARHFHQFAEQFFYVVSGIATIEVNKEIFHLEKSHGLHIPPNTPHQLFNEQACDLVFIVTSTPPSHGDRFEART